MERYTLQQRIEIIKIHYKNGENLAQATKLLLFYGKSFRTELSLEEVITIGHRDIVI